MDLILSGLFCFFSCKVLLDHLEHGFAGWFDHDHAGHNANLQPQDKDV